MNSKIFFRGGFLISALFFAGCASSPQLYPNKKLVSVGKDVANQDIKTCEDLADNYVQSNKGKQIATAAGKGMVVGGATGAVAGLFSHANAGSTALKGAAIGGTVAGTSAALSPDQMKRSFVNECLAERGYKVIGWN